MEKAHLDSKRETVFDGEGREYRLTPLRVELLRYMASRTGEVVTPIEIAQAFVCDRDDVRHLVARTRAATWPGVLHTYVGHGYLTDLVLR